MASYDVVIAGGGVNGLACGATLAREGLSVCVIERNAWVGGGAVTIIASGLSSPSNLALDDTSVYWVSEGDGNVMKAPK